MTLKVIITNGETIMDHSIQVRPVVPGEAPDLSIYPRRLVSGETATFYVHVGQELHITEVATRAHTI